MSDAPQDKVLTGTVCVQAQFDVLIYSYDGIRDKTLFADKATRRLSLRLTNAGFCLDEFRLAGVEVVLDPPAESAEKEE